MLTLTHACGCFMVVFNSVRTRRFDWHGVKGYFAQIHISYTRADHSRMPFHVRIRSTLASVEHKRQRADAVELLYGKADVLSLSCTSCVTPMNPKQYFDPQS